MTRTLSRPALMLIMAALLFLATFELSPLLWLLSASFKTSGDVFANPPQLIPAHPTLENYGYVWNSGGVATYFLNSLLASGGTVLLNLAAASLAGYALARMRFRGREGVFMLGLSTLVIPFPSIMLPLFVITKDLGLTDNLLGIIVPTAATTLWLSVYILREGFRAIPMEIEEAAVVDGCSVFRLWWRIMLPLNRAPLATAAILIFTLTWSDFLWPLVVMRDPQHFTLSIGLQYFMSILTSNWHHIAAIAIIASIPTLVLFVTLQRQFFSGATAGAVKG